ncbi:MAG: hypothetical protein ACLFU7_00140 [Armatimonadota bacterium]
MRIAQVTATALVLVAVVAGAAHAQNDGVTITFTDTKTLIYQGTGDMRAATPADCPITVGNFRITRVHLPAQSNLDDVGLVIPFRGALSERMVNLDPRWGGAEPLALICEVIDPEQPIGFRARAHARARMYHSPGSWLEMNLARGPKDTRPIPASAQNKRFSGDMHRWYALSDINEIYHRAENAPVPENDRFAILLSTGERGSWWIKSLELKAWPTQTDR